MAGRAEATRVRVCLLGRFELVVGGEVVTVASPKERALVARLALDAGSTVPAERLVDALWPDGAQPADPMRALRYHVWHLRDLIDPDRAARTDPTVLRTDGSGYRLAVDPDAVDALRVQHEWDRLRRDGGDPVAHQRALHDLLLDWHPAAFSTGDDGPLAEAATHLDRLRAAALEARVVADLAAGLGAELVPDLERLVAESPFDERLRGCLMTALYRAGRQADALAVYTATRRLLVDELGVEPGLDLRELEQQILDHDPALLGARPELAPTRTPVARRSRLPQFGDSFVGREAELADVAGLLAAYRLVTLTGVGGTGKTRLAVEVLREVEASGTVDEIFLVELASVSDEATVAIAIAEAWGLTVADASPVDVVVRFLAEREAVVLVDNCEHVRAAAAAVIERILRDAPDVTVLATSRESLGVGGEVIVRVPGLSGEFTEDGADAAHELFVERGARARPGWAPTAPDLAAIARICARVDGIPLGIELAAARLRSMNPAEIADHLDQTVGLLALSSKGTVERQRTLAATVDWSFRLLSPTEQDVFLAACVFAGDFSAAALAAVTNAAPAVDVTDIADSLVDKSLLVPVHRGPVTRLRVLEPLRQWGVARLGDDGRVDELRDRHAAFFEALAHRLSPGTISFGAAEALAELSAEVANVRAAFVTLAAAGEWERHLRMAFDMFPVWTHHDGQLEGHRRCLEGLAAAGDHIDREVRMRAAFVGATCGGWCRVPTAHEPADLLIRLADETGRPRIRSWGSLAKAVVLGNDGLPRSVGDPASIDMMRRAAELWTSEGAGEWWAAAWEEGIHQLCRAVFLPPSPERWPDFLAAEAAFVEAGDRGWLTVLYSQALDVQPWCGTAVARTLLERAIHFGVSPVWSRNARQRLAVLDLIDGDDAAAIAAFRDIIAESEVIGDRPSTTERRYLAVALSRLGEQAEPRQLLLQAFDATVGLSDREVLRTFAASGYVLARAGEWEAAARALGAAEQMQEQWFDILGRARTLVTEAIGAEACARFEADGAAVGATAMLAELRARLSSAP